MMDWDSKGSVTPAEAGSVILVTTLDLGASTALVVLCGCRQKHEQPEGRHLTHKHIPNSGKAQQQGLAKLELYS